MSFQISVTPSRRAAARFIASVRRELLKALADEEAKGSNGIKQADIARAIGVNRSVVHRELRGHADITLGRLAELAWALGRKPVFELEVVKTAPQSNGPPPGADAAQFKSSVQVSGTSAELRQPDLVLG